MAEREDTPPCCFIIHGFGCHENRRKNFTAGAGRGVSASKVGGIQNKLGPQSDPSHAPAAGIDMLMHHQVLSARHGILEILAMDHRTGFDLGLHLALGRGFERFD